MAYTIFGKVGIEMKKICMVLCSVLCLFTACSKSVPPHQLTKPLCPLTGMQYQSTIDATCMVMMNNAPQARPQTGLDRADVVVEMLAEGEITRFAAFYSSQMKGTVGPVRSVRDYFYDLAKGAKAVVVSAGGEKGVLKEIKKDGYPSLDGIHADEKYFTRVSFRKAPHNLYTNFEHIKQALKDKKITEVSPAKYLFSSEPVSKLGKPAQKINLTYHPLYHCGYQYDVPSGNYIRYTEGVQQLDRETSRPLMMQNVLVIYAKHRVADYLGHRSIDITKSGQGYLCQKGKFIPIEWSFRKGLVVPIIGGKEVSLLPGKTWVNVLPEMRRVDFQ